MGLLKVSINERQRRIDSQHCRCFYCGDKITVDSSQVEHILPYSKYKNNSKYNLCMSCIDCNYLKRNHEIEDFKTIFKSVYPEKLIRGMFYFEFLELKNIDNIKGQHYEEAQRNIAWHHDL